MNTMAELKRIVEESRQELIARVWKDYGLHLPELERIQNKLKDTQVVYFESGKRVLGRTLPRTNLIELNWKELLTMNPEQQKDVVIHEFFHVIAYERFGKSVGHSVHFKRLVKIYGYPERIGMAAIVEEKPASAWKYALVCEKCGRVLGYRDRKSNLSRYVSTCCKSEIVFMNNN